MLDSKHPDCLKISRDWFCAVVLVGLAIAIFVYQPAANVPAASQALVLELKSAKPTCTINDVIDGDTLKVDVQLVGDIWLKNATMRIVNIDAIELVDPNGREAAAWVREFVAQPGCQVHIEKKRDKYGRLLGDVEHGGKFLSDLLLEKNFAKPYYN